MRNPLGKRRDALLKGGQTGTERAQLVAHLSAQVRAVSARPAAGAGGAFATGQEGEVNDVRFVKDGVARALRTLRAATSPEPGDSVVPLSAQMIWLRFTAATAATGVESRVTAHSGRVGLASELTSRGASTTDVMLAGNWKTSRMVAHYSAGATRNAVPSHATFNQRVSR